MNEFALRQFLRAVALGKLDASDPEVRAVLREVHGGGGVRRRSFSIVRTRAATTLGKLSGVASAYGVDYSIGAGLKERIAAGAFADSIAERPNVPLFLGHDWLNPIGVAALSDSPAGLLFDADVFSENERARSVYEAAKANALDNVSIGFYPETITTNANEPDVEIVERGTVVEVSIVVKGANPSAHVQKVA